MRSLHSATELTSRSFQLRRGRASCSHTALPLQAVVLACGSLRAIHDFRIDSEKALSSNHGFEQDRRASSWRAGNHILSVKKMLQYHAALLFMDKTVFSIRKPNIDCAANFHLIILHPGSAKALTSPFFSACVLCHCGLVDNSPRC